ncbi:MAG: ABC transporter substrate-binding protein [Mesorhizobium sp.]|nr:MAG: ABC transporter substrate-binding protein [Mesorhizobium sp.]
MPAAAEDLTPVRFVFNWSSADHAITPVAVGIEKGFYKDEGLKVDVILPPDSQTTARLLSVGQADIGFEATTDVVFGAVRLAPRERRARGRNGPAIWHRARGQAWPRPKAHRPLTQWQCRRPSRRRP